MSYIALFKAGNIQQHVLSCSYSLYQEVDPTGRPSSISRGGQIRLEVEGNHNTELFEWMCNSLEHKDGSVTFINEDGNVTLKELCFKEGYLINFSESFSSTNSNPLNIVLTISTREIKMGSGTHTNEW